MALIPVVVSVTLAIQVGPPDTVVVRAVLPPPNLTAVEEIRLGSLDGPEEATFGWVEAIAVDAEGTMYVADAQVSAVRVFNADGDYEGDLGSRGEGPGEFTAVRGLAALPGGGVAVWHEMDQLSVFDSTGRFVDRFSMRFSSIAGGPGPSVVADTAGHVFVRTTAGRPLPEAPFIIRYAWVHYTTQGEFIDSIIAPERAVEGALPAFRTETLSFPSPHEYFVTGRNDEYAVFRPLRDGRVLRIERPYEPIQIEGEERDQWEAYVDEWYRRRDQRPASIDTAKPPWRQLYVGADGRIWVFRYTEAEHHPGHITTAAERGGWPTIEWLEPSVYEVFDPRGSLLGSVTLPRDSEILFARGQKVWTLERGQYDEHYVVRYRVEGLPGAG